MASFLNAAGFQDAQEDRLVHPMHWTDEEHYFQSILKATPIGHSLSEETPEIQRQVLEETRSNLTKWRTADGLTIPGECVFVTATK